MIHNITLISIITVAILTLLTYLDANNDDDDE